MTKELSEFIHFVYQAITALISSGCGLALITFWSNRRKEHIEAEGMAYDKRLSALDGRLRTTEAALAETNKKLKQTETNISTTGSDIKTTLTKATSTIVERLELDEGNIKVIDQKVDNLGKVILKK